MHPFSELNQLNQRNLVVSVEYRDEGFLDGMWRATVSVQKTRDSPVVVGKGAGLSKATAKRLAAQTALQKVQTRPESPLDIDSGYSSDSDEYTTLPLAEERTVKQRAILQKAQAHFEVLGEMTAARMLSSTPYLFVSIDIETYAGSQTILEIGLAWIFGHEVWGGQNYAPPIQCHHLIVEDNICLKNHGEYDQRENFRFGISHRVSEAEVSATMARLLPASVRKGAHIFLVGHTIWNDIAWLEHIDVDASELLPRFLVCDVGQAFQFSRDATQSTSLGRMLTHYGLSGENLHNAGNDAYYGIQVTLKMMEELGRKQMEILSSEVWNKQI